jgi:hypothetical protein
MNKKEKLAAQEREEHAVLSRLASSDVVSLKYKEMEENTFQSTMEDYDSLMKLAKKFKLSLLEAEKVRDRMIKHLQHSNLTLNFKAEKLFASKLKGGIMNTHERSGESRISYLDSRIRAEETLFGYSRSRSQKGKDQGIFDRIKKFGDITNNIDFAPSMRPKYGALNFMNSSSGAAPLYGSSYMVLKEHAKFNCTFTAGDSFDYSGTPKGANQVATYTNMHRIITNMKDDMMEKLYKMTISSGSCSQPGPVYIEAQIHGEIQFGRDVKEMHINSNDAGFKTIPKISEHIKKFGRKYGIPIFSI